MSNRLIFKMVFVVILVAILLGLVFIIYDKTGTMAHIYDPLIVSEYTIVDENEICEAGEEFLWEDDEYEYYLPCLSSYKIFLEWTDGDRDLIKNALNNNKVDIDSLLKHGLTVNKHAKS